MKSIGYGAYGEYDGLGYADEPQWGMFNPSQSLFRSDPTIYDSLYATNRDADENLDFSRKGHRRNTVGLPYQVGPRKAWKRSGAPSLYAPTGTNHHKGLTPRGELSNYGNYGQEESSPVETVKAAGLMMSPMVLLVGMILFIKIFNIGG